MSRITLILHLIYTYISFGVYSIKLLTKAVIHRYTYRKTSSPRSVVVIGASFAGWTCTEQLSRLLPTGWQVIVIEKSSHVGFTWLWPRISVMSKHEEKAFIPFPDKPRMAPDGVFVFKQGNVVKFQADHILLENGERIPFSYLVLATGQTSRYPYDLTESTKESGISYFKSRRKQVQAAKSIAVVGGGPVGVEIALDIKSFFPEKRTSLYHSRDRLCNNYSLGLHERCMEMAGELAVDVYLDQRPSVDGMNVTLNNGEKRKYDLVVCCSFRRDEIFTDGI